MQRRQDLLPKPLVSKNEAMWCGQGIAAETRQSGARPSTSVTYPSDITFPCACHSNLDGIDMTMRWDTRPARGWLGCIRCNGQQHGAPSTAMPFYGIEGQLFS